MMVHGVVCNFRCMCVFCFVALIPLAEFSDPHTMKKYGIKPDAETLDIVTTATAQKEVISPIILNLASLSPTTLSF